MADIPKRIIDLDARANAIAGDYFEVDNDSILSLADKSRRIALDKFLPFDVDSQEIGIWPLKSQLKKEVTLPNAADILCILGLSLFDDNGKMYGNTLYVKEFHQQIRPLGAGNNNISGNTGNTNSATNKLVYAGTYDGALNITHIYNPNNITPTASYVSYIMKITHNLNISSNGGKYIVNIISKSPNVEWISNAVNANYFEVQSHGLSGNTDYKNSPFDFEIIEITPADNHSHTIGLQGIGISVSGGYLGKSIVVTPQLDVNTGVCTLFHNFLSSSQSKDSAVIGDSVLSANVLNDYSSPSINRGVIYLLRKRQTTL